MKSVTYSTSRKTIIYKVFWNWRPVCIPKIICRAFNKITYFRRDMFNSHFFVLLFMLLIRSVSWGCRIHWVQLCRVVTPPTECPLYDAKQSYGDVPVMLELWGMQSNPFIAIAPRSILTRSGSNWENPIHGSNRSKLHTFALEIKLFWHLNCELMINWIVWKRI